MIQRGLSRAYTVIELLMSLTVLAIGVAGVIAMQKVTIASNMHARNLAVATRVAQAWADALAIDGSQWNSTNDLADTNWLNLVGVNELTWTRPVYNGTLRFGPAFGPLGNPVQDNRLAAFCTDIRLAWLRRDTATDPQPGAGLIRAEIRVFWKRESSALAAPADFCNPAQNPPDGLNVAPGTADAFHFVYLTTAVPEYIGEGA